MPASSAKTTPTPRVPPPQRGWLGSGARTVARYLYALQRDLWLGDLTLRASSLVYTTLLSIVPLIAFALLLLKGVGLEYDLAPVLGEFLRPLGGMADELTANIIASVMRLQGRLVGIVGFIALSVSVIGAVQKLEAAMNFIWRVPRLRETRRRLGDYLVLLLAGPIVMITTLSVASGLTHHNSLVWLRSHTSIGPLFEAIHLLTPWLTVGLALTFLYRVIPNTRVRTEAALIAGLCASIAWVGAGRVFAVLGADAVHMMAVYAGFAIAMLALVWIWLSWIILLLGAQLAFYIQNPRYLSAASHAVTPRSTLNERLALSSLILISQAARANQMAYTAAALADRLSIPGGDLSSVLNHLIQANLISVRGDRRLQLARKPEQIPLAEIIAAIHEPLDGIDESPTLTVADNFVAELSRQRQAYLLGRTLQDLI